MNRFEQTFFANYIQHDDEIIDVFHRHVFVIIFDMLLWMIVGAILPSWLYTILFLGESQILWFDIPFWVLGIYLGLVWIILMFKLFDWYNDVWIVTKRGIVDLEWSPLTKNTTFSEYNDITGIESNEANWFDSFFRMGDLIIHKIGADLRISRLARPGVAVDTIQDIKHEVTTPDPKPVGNDMHIYFDGVKQQVKVGKNGHLYTQDSDDELEGKYIDEVKGKKDTIDLSKKK